MTGNLSAAEAPVIRIETWGKRTAVCIVPRRVDRPSRTFGSSSEALACADDLSRQHGWPIEVLP